jgi:hypothetical protein
MSILQVNSIANVAGTGPTSLYPYGALGNPTGLAPPAGSVGEYIETYAGSTTYGNTSLANVWTDASGGSSWLITIEAGTWLIGYALCFSLRDNSGSSNQIDANVAIYDGSSILNNSISGCEASVLGNQLFRWTAHRQMLYLTASSKTLTMQTRCAADAASSTAFIDGNNTLTGPSGINNASALWALRIF